MHKAIDVTIQNVWLVQKSIFNYSLEHVHGHQDVNMEKSELSPIAKINVEMDILAGEYLSPLDKSQTFHEPLAFPSQQVGLMIDEQRIATNIEDELIAEYFKESIIKHYKNVVKVPGKAFENIQ